MADKNHLKPELLLDKNICFNYLVGHLLKNIVKTTNEHINVICDNRDVKITSHKTLEGYLRLKAYADWGFGYKLNLQYGDSEFMDLLQIVDVISNTVHGRYEMKKAHFYRLIKPHKKHGILFPYEIFGT